MTEELLTAQSVLNAAPGVSAVRAFLAHARDDAYSQSLALREFVDLSDAVKEQKLDFAFGKCGSLTLASNLLNVASYHPFVDTGLLREFGAKLEGSIFSDLALLTNNWDKECNLDGFLGAAHGWAGYLYSILKWHGTVGEAVPLEFACLLEKLSTYGVPIGRGISWPRQLPSNNPVYLSSWCNGSAGFVHLWVAAHRVLKDERWLNLAESSAWACWDATHEAGGDLCCGTSGRAYAMLELYRATGNRDWYERAVSLARHAIGAIQQFTPLGIGLYKGLIGVLVLCSDLMSDSQGSMPFFGDEC